MRAFPPDLTCVKTSENVVRLHLGHVLLVFLFLTALSFPTWDYSDAESQICFNATGTGTIYGKLWSTPWTVFDVALPKNSTFFNEGLTGSFGFFVYAQNATHVFVALPALNNLTSQRYCIYSGGTDTEGLNSNVASIFYQNTQGSWANGSGQNVSYGETLNISSSTSSSAYSYQLVSWSITNYYVKSKQNTSYIGAGPIANNNKACFGPSSTSTTCNGGLMFYSNYTWQFDGKNIYQDAGLNEWRISESRSNASTFNASILDENMSLLGTNSGTAAVSRYYATALATNATLRMDWMFVGRIGPVSYTPNVSDITFDFQDTNITFTSPAWSADFSADDTALISVYYARAYDTCNLTINGDVVATYAPTIGQTVTTSLDMGLGNLGDNELVANCSLGGVEYHRYHSIIKTGSTAEDVFTLAFGDSPIGLGCPSNTSIALENCFEAYNITTPTDFAAVICPTFNFSYNYTCLRADAINKSGYTIFFRPSGRNGGAANFSYPGASGFPTINTEHLGADFTYYGADLDVGIEILSLPNTSGNYNGTFIYIPAQYKPIDCSIYYLNTNNCSWGSGVILNNASIILSDRSNNWFTIGGVGIIPFDYNYSQTRQGYSVFTITASSPELFPNGIYTRLNCYIDNANQTFEVRIKNTIAKNYTYYAQITGSPAINTTTESYQFYQSTNLTNLVQLIMYDTNEGTELCRYQNGSTLFLPFVLPDDLMPASFEIITWAIMIFMTVLTSMVPFAAILMIIWNDVYHMLNISQLCTVCMLSIVFGFVNASFNMERGIKHMLIILAIATAYLSLIEPFATTEGIDISGFDSTIMSFNNLRDANDIGTFVLGIPGFVINLFILLLTLPLTVVDFVLSMMKLISVPLWNVAQSMAPFLKLGFVLYFYLKAYEVLSNRFRPV